MIESITFITASIENLPDEACNWRTISGHKFVSDSNSSCSISNANNANQGVVAEWLEKNPAGCEPPRNGMNADDAFDLSSLCA